MLYIIMLTMANKPETVWYRLPTFSHLCVSHGGIIYISLWITCDNIN